MPFSVADMFPSMAYAVDVERVKTLFDKFVCRKLGVSLEPERFSCEGVKRRCGSKSKA